MIPLGILAQARSLVFSDSLIAPAAGTPIITRPGWSRAEGSSLTGELYSDTAGIVSNTTSGTKAVLSPDTESVNHYAQAVLRAGQYGNNGLCIAWTDNGNMFTLGLDSNLNLALMRLVDYAATTITYAAGIAPGLFRLSRQGNTLRADSSADNGVTWTNVLFSSSGAYATSATRTGIYFRDTGSFAAGPFKSGPILP